MTNLPEPVRTHHLLDPSMLRAAVSPTAVAVTAAGVGIGLLNHSVILAVVLGACAWSARMVAALISRARRRSTSRLKPAALDPYSVPEPWRQLVHQTLDVQTRFDQALRDWSEGPIRDHLTALQPQIYAHASEVGSLALRGAALSGWNRGVKSTGRPSLEQLSGQLDAAQRSGDRGAEEALAAQVRAARAADEASRQLRDRLTSVVARFDEAVTSMLLIDTGGSGTEQLSRSLGALQDEIVALQRGLADATAASGSAQLEPPPPPQTP